jgi:hypothetical protein
MERAAHLNVPFVRRRSRPRAWVILLCLTPILAAFYVLLPVTGRFRGSVSLTPEA